MSFIDLLYSKIARLIPPFLHASRHGCAVVCRHHQRCLFDTPLFCLHVILCPVYGLSRLIVAIMNPRGVPTIVLDHLDAAGLMNDWGHRRSDGVTHDKRRGIPTFGQILNDNAIIFKPGAAPKDGGLMVEQGCPGNGMGHPKVGAGQTKPFMGIKIDRVQLGRLVKIWDASMGGYNFRVGFLNDDWEPFNQSPR